MRLLSTIEESATQYVDLIHETLIRARSRDANGKLFGYWPTLFNYIQRNPDRDLRRQQLVLQTERWKSSSPIARWLHLAGWATLFHYRNLRMPKHSSEGQFLALSRRKAASQFGLLSVILGALVQSAWWISVNNLPLAYAFIQPFWYLGFRPIPETMTVPPGSFTMGCKVGRDDVGGACPDGVAATMDVDLPKPCALGKYEVTFLEYDYYVWANGGKWAAPDKYPTDFGFGRLFRPVIFVNWDEAQSYVRWLAKSTGKSYRLPTEVEWEYAARAGSQTVYWWGNPLGTSRANCAACGTQWSDKGTAPVGSFGPNPWGLYDTAGNVWEWVDSGPLAYPWPANLSALPTNNQRWARGGSFDDQEGGARLAMRGEAEPSRRGSNVGFRVCLDSARPVD